MPNALVRGAEKAQVWNRAGIKAQKSSAENTEKAKYITTSWLGEKKKNSFESLPRSLHNDRGHHHHFHAQSCILI